MYFKKECIAMLLAGGQGSRLYDLTKQTAKPAVESHPLAAKWKVGRTVYHDDYGYGGIVRTRVEEEEFVVVVKFETGAEKQFMPEYQSQLMITDR